jgi:hypothetical protein
VESVEIRDAVNAEDDRLTVQHKPSLAPYVDGYHKPSVVRVARSVIVLL